jgi:tetratricopeptide (TPR) repeat protein
MDCRRAVLARRSTRSPRSFALLAFCLAASLSLAAAAAPPPTARSYLDSGLRLYKEGHYEAAIRELRLGYALEPLPEILYTLGQSARKLGRCEEAIGYYRQYLQRGADAASAGAARFQIERCEQQLRDEQAAAAARAPTATAAAPAPSPSPSPSPPPPPPPPRRPFYKDALGMTLGGIGLGAALAGGGLLIGSAVTMQHSRTTLQQFDDALPRAQTMRTTGIVLTAGGGALLLAGVIRLSLVARRAHEGGPR